MHEYTSSLHLFLLKAACARHPYNPQFNRDLPRAAPSTMIVPSLFSLPLLEASRNFKPTSPTILVVFLMDFPTVFGLWQTPFKHSKIHNFSSHTPPLFPHSVMRYKFLWNPLSPREQGLFSPWSSGRHGHIPVIIRYKKQTVIAGNRAIKMGELGEREEIAMQEVHSVVSSILRS